MLVPDYQKYFKDFTAAAISCGMSVEILGDVFDKSIVFAKTPHDPNRPGVLVFSGFHGEEFAGPLGVLRCLQNPANRSFFSKINVGIVPIANPNGFDLEKRYNQLDQESNWALRFGPDGKPSFEGQILLGSMDELKQYATTCFLDMHEDDSADGFYLYTFSQSGAVELWHTALLGVGVKHFGVHPDGPIPGALEETDPDSEPEISRPGTTAHIQGGVVAFDHDGSFDEFFHKNGAVASAVTETPASKPLETRVACNEELLTTTLEWAASIVSRVSHRLARKI